MKNVVDPLNFNCKIVNLYCIYKLFSIHNICGLLLWTFYQYYMNLASIRKIYYITFNFIYKANSILTTKDIIFSEYLLVKKWKIKGYI